MKLLTIQPIKELRGNISIIEKILPFEIKRIYYIYNVDANEIRGGHKHKDTVQFLISVVGSCKIKVINKNTQTDKEVLLDSPEAGLLLESEDWHQMYDFSSDCLLLVLASSEYSKNNYILEI